MKGAHMRRILAVLTALMLLMTLGYTAAFALVPATPDVCPTDTPWEGHFGADTRTGAWGSITGTASGSDFTVLATINAGYTVEVCVKKGSEPSDGGTEFYPLVGPVTGQAVVHTLGAAVSHWAYKIVTTPSTTTIPTSSTTTQPEGTTTTTRPTTITVPPTTTTTTEPCFDNEVRNEAGECVPGGSTTTMAPTTTEPEVTAETLPFTGPSAPTGMLALLAGGLVTLGGAMLIGGRRKSEDEGVDLGTWG